MGQAKNRAAEIENLKLQGPRRKELGQVFTPFPLVKEMLDKIDTWNLPIHEMKWQTILEPACGNGQFVLGVIRKLMDRYEAEQIFNPEDADKNRNMAFKHIMQNQLFAIELDEEMRQECISRVKEMGRAYGVDEIFLDVLNHNIIQGNTLELDFDRCFIDNMKNWESPFFIVNAWQMIGTLTFSLSGMMVNELCEPGFDIERAMSFIKANQ